MGEENVTCMKLFIYFFCPASLKDFDAALKDFDASLKDFDVALKDFDAALKDFDAALRDRLSCVPSCRVCTV